ncbi:MULTISPECIES: hypothetical protein [unclassified Candidatus Paralachnospira]|uniref:hypothetical protein n=1 Tax=unclassified Candidatus Paralachnospira TaxID=3099471 RepID=UPI003F921107
MRERKIQGRKQKRGIRAAAWCLAVILLLGAALTPVGTVFAAPPGGIWDGESVSMPKTDENGTFLISTGAELAWFAKEVNSGNGRINARLEKNIYLNNYNTRYLWMMIGDTTAHPFRGSFDGNGKRINYMRVRITTDDMSRPYGGLFGVIDGGVVKDLTVMGSVEHAFGNYGKFGAYDETACGSGAIAGYLKNGQIIRCTNKTTTTMEGETMNRNAGGIVGLCKGQVIRCVNQGVITTQVHMAQNQIGGIVGLLYGEQAQILYSVNKGEVQGYFTVGGIAGAVKYGAEIRNCCNYGTIVGNSILGGIAGKIGGTGTASDGTAKQSVISTVYNLGSIEGGDITNSPSHMGGIVGEAGYDDWKEEELPPMPVIETGYSTAVYEGTVFDMRGAVIGYFKSGTAGRLYGLQYGKLQPIALKDIKGTTLSGEVALKTEADMKKALFVRRLGNAFALPDGSDTENNGYPRFVWQGQTSELAKQVDEALLELKGWLSEENRAKYGTAYQELERIVASYEEKLSLIDSEKALEELMKSAREELSAVKPGSQVDSELAEAIDQGITALEEYRDSLLEAHEDLKEEQKKELDFYVTDYSGQLQNAKDSDEVKRLVRNGKDDMDAYIAACEEAKRIEEVRRNAVNALNAYRTEPQEEPWAAQIAAARSTGIEKIRAAESVSGITEALNEAREMIDRILEQIPDEDAWDGETKTEPKSDDKGVYQITSGAELAWFAELVNKSGSRTKFQAVLCNDINLGNQEWTPIGMKKNVYRGSFDGGGYKIRGLLVTEAENYAGLFGIVYGDEKDSIRNLTVAGTVNCSNRVQYAGGLIGYIYGKNDGQRPSVQDCHNEASVTVREVRISSSAIGGIAGRAEFTWFRNCSNTGTVSFPTEGKGGIHYYAGGLIGSTGLSISLRRSYNSGSVQADSSAGGLVGKLAGSGAKVTSCYNSGEVKSKRYAGGLVGQIGSEAAGSQVSWCYNCGPINLNINGRYMGAIFGGMEAGDYENLFALKRTDQPDRAMVGYSADFTSPGYFLSASELQSDEYLNSLNGGGNHFIHDYLGFQSGYPILSWQLTLEDLKTGAVSELESFVSEEDYEPENWALVKQEIEAGSERIRAGSTMDEVSAILTETKEAIYQIESKADAEARKLKEEKEAALSLLEHYVDPEQYREEEQMKLETYLADARKLIAAAETRDEVARHLRETKENIDALPTASQYQYAADKAAAAQTDSYIRNIGDVVLAAYVKTAIRIARASYDGLTDAQKELVEHYQTLLDAEEAYRKLEEEFQVTDEDIELAKQVDALIAAIGEVTPESEEAIHKARLAYDSLTEAQKRLVESPEILFQAEEAYDHLRAAEVSAVIASMGMITLDRREVIEHAQSLYDSLTETQKSYVTDYPVLAAAVERFKDLTAAAPVEKLIASIGEVTLNSQAAIEQAILAYNALTGNQQALVSNYGILEQAAAAFDRLSAVADVILKIDRIGAVSSASGGAIQEARAAYDALDAEQKAQVTNYGVLEQAEAAYRALTAPEPDLDQGGGYHTGGAGGNAGRGETNGELHTGGAGAAEAAAGTESEALADDPQLLLEELLEQIVDAGEQGVLLTEDVYDEAADGIPAEAETEAEDPLAGQVSVEEERRTLLKASRKRTVRLLGILLAASGTVAVFLVGTAVASAKKRKEKRVRY